MSEENKRLYEEAQRRLREVTTLYEASQACLSISDQKGLLTAIIEAAARATDATLGSVMLVDEEQGEYVFGAHYALSQETIATIEAELHIPLGEGLVGAVVTTGQPLVVADVSTDPRWIPMEMKEPMRSFLGVPLVGRDGQPLGALTLSRPDVGAFDEDHARLLSTFANQAAMAIENARLYEQAQQEITERKLAEEALAHERDLLRALMDSIPDTIYFKDAASRFMRINKAQARVLGVDPEEAIGKTDFDFFTEEHARDAYADEQGIVESGQLLIDKIEKIRRADGQFRWVSATKVPTKDKEGRVTGIVGIGAIDNCRKTISLRKLKYRIKCLCFAEVAAHRCVRQIVWVFNLVTINQNMSSTDLCGDSPGIFQFSLCQAGRDNG